MPPAKPKSTSNKRKKCTPRNQCCEPNSDDGMPLPPPGAPIVDFFLVEHELPSDLQATPPRPQSSTSHARTRIRPTGKLRQIHPSPLSDRSSSGPDIIYQTTTSKKGDSPQDGRSPSPNPATVQDGRDGPDDSQNDSSNSNSTQALLSPFIEKAPPSRYVYVDDDSDDEGTYAALVRLAAATPTATPTTSARLAAASSTSVHVAMALPAAKSAVVIVISDDESPAASHSTPIIISDSETEYAVSDIELTDELIAQLDHPITTRHSSPIIISDSDDEYIVSDIELNEAIIAQLDQIL